MLCIFTYFLEQKLKLGENTQHAGKVIAIFGETLPWTACLIILTDDLRTEAIFV